MIPDSGKATTVAPFRKPPSTPLTSPPRDEDATLEFAVETAPAVSDAPATFGQAVAPEPPAGIEAPATQSPHTSAPVRGRRSSALTIAAVAGCVILVGALVAVLTFGAPGASTGSVRVESDPQGAQVLVNGEPKGVTPLTLTLPAGSHSVVVQRGASVKQLAVDLTRGASKDYHVAWAEPSVTEVATESGSLSVASDTPGSVVIVDGTERGQTPVTIRDLPVGPHDVLVRGANAVYQRSVEVEAGATVSLVVGGTAAPQSWGWISLNAPFPVQVLEGNRVVGTSEIDRIMLPPGSHQLEFVSQLFSFSQRSRVNVSAGRGAPVSLTIPRVAMNINALPWAEVFIDGVRIGDTPLGNVMQPLGDHEVVFRHPQFGEKRQVVRVTPRDSVRISVDMRAR